MVLQDHEALDYGYYSDVISDISNKIPREEITLKEFLEIIDKQGRLITCMVLATPFLIPISIPGTGMLAGLAIFILSISILFDKHYLIPNRLMNRKISKKNLIKILDTTFQVLTRLEKHIKPRLLIMTNKAIMRKINGSLMILSAILFTAPLPIPLTNTLPALGVFLLAAGILEHDGYLILASYAVITITAIYFCSVILLGYEGLSIGLSYLGLN